MFNILKNPAVRFFLIAFFLYIGWFLFYDLWLHPLQSLDIAVISLIVSQSAWLLELLGYQLGDPMAYGESYRVLSIEGTRGVWIGDPCNGITLFALFTGFVLAYPGPVIKKSWFIPLGIISIHLLNVLRVVGLTLIQKYFPDSLDFNHTYTFTIIVYSWVFLLWYIWSAKMTTK